MPDSEQNAAQVIDAYRRRRERMIPLLLGGLAVVLLVVGLFLVVMWLTGDNPPALPGFLSSATPTATETATALPPSATPTITETPPPSETPTPEGPVTYRVELNDTLTAIADKFGVDVILLMSVNGITNPNAINVGQELIIPSAGTELPTATALPLTLVPGSKIEYIVQPGDNLQAIAAKFNSTAEKIAELNNMKVTDVLFVGLKLVVPVNIATPTPSATPNPNTATPTPLP
jgi:LysM repeat protein